MPLTLITPTGCRPEAFLLCQQYMLQQRYTGQVQWIIVDDGEQESPRLPFDCKSNWSLINLRPTPFWKLRDNTQCRNFLEALPFTSYSKTVIIEDDDYYHPDYLALMDERLEEGEVVGEKQALYYNVASRCYHYCKNETHSSLCQTGFRHEAYELFRHLVTVERKFIDIDIFQKANPKGVKLYNHTGYCIGIKGLPGRKGIGIGHTSPGRGVDWHPDPGLQYLQRVIGRDAKHYARYAKETAMDNADSQIRTFNWRGQTRYCCPSCTFDAPSEVGVLKHWQASHAEQPQQVGPTLFDGEGKELLSSESASLQVPPALRRLLE